MELDDLKTSWKEKASKPFARPDLQAMIQSRTDGPASVLAKRFRRGVILIVFLGWWVVSRFAKTNRDLSSNIFIWFFLIFCLFVVSYFIYSYLVLRRLQDASENVQANLEKQVTLLERLVHWRLIITRGLFLVFILLVEFSPQLKMSAFPGWEQQPLPLRISVYFAVFTILFFLTRFAVERRYGVPLKHLKSIVKDLGD